MKELYKYLKEQNFRQEIELRKTIKELIKKDSPEGLPRINKNTYMSKFRWKTGGFIYTIEKYKEQKDIISSKTASG